MDAPLSEAEQVARVVLACGLILTVSAALALLFDRLTGRGTGAMAMVRIVGTAGVVLLLIAWGIWP